MEPVGPVGVAVVGAACLAFEGSGTGPGLLAVVVVVVAVAIAETDPVGLGIVLALTFGFRRGSVSFADSASVCLDFDPAIELFLDKAAPVAAPTGSDQHPVQDSSLVDYCGSVDSECFVGFVLVD